MIQAQEVQVERGQCRVALDAETQSALGVEHSELIYRKSQAETYAMTHKDSANPAEADLAAKLQDCVAQLDGPSSPILTIVMVVLLAIIVVVAVAALIKSQSRNSSR